MRREPRACSSPRSLLITDAFRARRSIMRIGSCGAYTRGSRGASTYVRFIIYIYRGTRVYVSRDRLDGERVRCGLGGERGITEARALMAPLFPSLFFFISLVRLIIDEANLRARTRGISLPFGRKNIRCWRWRGRGRVFETRARRSCAREIVGRRKNEWNSF